MTHQGWRRTLDPPHGPRAGGRVRPTLFIGPPRQLGGPLLEVMVEVTPPRELHIFHVMLARPKHLDRIVDTE